MRNICLTFFPVRILQTLCLCVTILFSSILILSYAETSPPAVDPLFHKPIFASAFSKLKTEPTMCQTIKNSRSSTMNSNSSSRDEFFGDSDVVSQVSDEDERDSAGAAAFVQLKHHAEVRKLKVESSGKAFRRKCIHKLEDCFSLSSLEVDLGDDDDDDENDVEPDIAETRFSSMSRRGSLDFIPSRPMSSEREVRRVVSHSELLRVQCLIPSPRSLSERSSMEVDQPPTDLRKALRESRWSSSSDRSMEEDALAALLDKVSSSYHDTADKDGESLVSTEKNSIEDCDDAFWVPLSRKSQCPVLPQRGSMPHDQRWYNNRIPSDTLPSPARPRS